MKKRLLSVLLALLTFSAAWAIDTESMYLAVLKVSQGNGSTNYGVTQNGGIPMLYASDASSKTYANGGMTAGDTVDFYVYTQPKYGYTMQWTLLSNGCAAIDNAAKAKGAKVTMTLSSTMGQQGAVQAMITPTFTQRSDTKFWVYYLPTEGLESYTIEGPDGYPALDADGKIATYTGDEITITANPAAGLTVSGWYTEDTQGNKTILSGKTGKTITMSFTEGTRIGATLAGPYKVGSTTAAQGTGYVNLQDALNAAESNHTKQSSDTVVWVTDDCALDGGEYTIPAGVTLLVPGESEECYYDEPEDTIMSTVSNTSLMMNPKFGLMAYYNKYSAGHIAPYRTLTLKNGAVLNINGRMSVSARVMAAGASTFLASGSPVEKYGNVVLEEGTKINVGSESSKGKLYVWGFMTGKGTVEAYSGSEIHEAFQYTDMAFMLQLMQIVLAAGNGQGLFPFSQYGIQNIESQVTFHYGAKNLVNAPVYVYTSVSDGVAVGLSMPTGNIDFITTYNTANKGVFMLKEGATLVRHYDGTRDKQCYDLNGSAAFGGVTVDLLEKMSAASDMFTLPITNNFEITLEEGAVLTSGIHVALMPGSKIDVKPGAKLEIGTNGLITAYDIADSRSWIADGVNYFPLTYVPGRDITHNKVYLGAQMLETFASCFTSGNMVSAFSNTLGALILDIPSAEIDINGTLNMNGPLLTTKHGANVHSSNGSGVVNVNLQEFSTNNSALQNFVARDAVYAIDASSPLGVRLDSIVAYRFIHDWQHSDSTNSKIDTICSHIAYLKNSGNTYLNTMENTIFSRMYQSQPLVLKVTYNNGSWSMQTCDLMAYNDKGELGYYTADEFQQVSDESSNVVAVLEDQTTYGTLSDEQKTNVILQTTNKTTDSEGNVTKVDTTYSCTSFVIEDNKDYDLPAGVDTVTTSSIEYTRKNLTGAWGSICLPFDVLSDGDVTYYELAKIEKGEMLFEKVDTVYANTPAVFRSLNGSSLEIITSGKICAVEVDPENPSLQYVTDEAEEGYEWTLIGTYTQDTIFYPKDAKNAGKYYISKNRFWKFGQNTNLFLVMPPFRAYFDRKASSSNGNESTAPARFTVGIWNPISGEVTHLGEMDENGNIHETSKILRDGKIYLIRGGRIYNVAGQLVK